MYFFAFNNWLVFDCKSDYNWFIFDNWDDSYCLKFCSVFSNDDFEFWDSKRNDYFNYEICFRFSAIVYLKFKFSDVSPTTRSSRFLIEFSFETNSSLR